MSKKKKEDFYPDWVCFECGKKWGKRKDYEDMCCTCHTGTCNICGERKTVTEPRDFGYLKDGWEVDLKYKPT